MSKNNHAPKKNTKKPPPAGLTSERLYKTLDNLQVADLALQLADGAVLDREEAGAVARLLMSERRRILEVIGTLDADFAAHMRAAEAESGEPIPYRPTVAKNSRKRGVA